MDHNHHRHKLCRIAKFTKGTAVKGQHESFERLKQKAFDTKYDDAFLAETPILEDFVLPVKELYVRVWNYFVLKFELRNYEFELRIQITNSKYENESKPFEALVAKSW